MSPHYDIDALSAAVRKEREARGGTGEPVRVGPSGDPAEDALQRMQAEWNCQAGIPLSAYPGRRPVVAVVRKIFRRLFQPFINEALDRQLRFNRAAVDSATETSLRVAELQAEVRALRQHLEAGRDRPGGGADPAGGGEGRSAP